MENLKIGIIESSLSGGEGELEALAKEMQSLKVETSRLGVELDRLTVLRDSLFDSLTDSSKLVNNNSS